MKGSVVLVTGATRGIGYAVAEAFAAAQAKVVICATKQETCDAVAQQLQQQYQTETMGIACDVSKFVSVQTVVDAVITRFQRIDVLVNNAGITRDNLLIRMSEEEWQQVLNVNLNSVFYMTKAVIRGMMKQKSGRIINMASVVGVIGNAGQANYAASKAGIIGFTKSVAKEYGGKGVLCNAIAPGFIETDMTETLPKEYLNNIIAQVPLKKLGTVKHVADAALFLASESAAYITGQVLHVDGGMVI